MEFLEVPLFDEDLFKLWVRLAIDLFFVFLLVRFAYYQHQSDKNYVFTFMLMNIMIFFICFTLKKLDLGLGMALGLFAIFAIVRFRTDAIRVKEMTYFFLVIGLAVINSLSNKKTSYAELLFTNMFVILVACFMEMWFVQLKRVQVKVKLSSQDFVYDNLELLGPERRGDLIADLARQTGFEIKSVSVKNVDLNKGVAVLGIKFLPVAEDAPA
jgi:hypothetical protein